ncbi:MAG: class I SAM-dependent DNA methyltransferase, partial [Candidatus Hermodarchaeota archaeon]
SAGTSQNNPLETRLRQKGVSEKAVKQKKLSADELFKDFGPTNKLALTAINIFYNKLTITKNAKTKLSFENWNKLFSRITGYDRERLQELNEFYNTAEKDLTKFLFSIHTYCALVMKLLAGELAYLYGDGEYFESYLTELETSSMRALDEFRSSLSDLEQGRIFKSLLKITNFVESDYFSWYLNEFDESLMEIITQIIRTLSDYELTISIQEPEATQDLMKIIYLGLIPRPVRHNLGEYYTPNWLAQFLLNKLDFNVHFFEKMAIDMEDLAHPLQLRLLDPACGSGTFLIEALKRVRNYVEKNSIRELMSEYTIKNIVGLDLNPLAVLAAKTNYLLNFGSLLSYTSDIEIPIYLADSITIKNASVPLIIDKFDYVVGNPPWILWDNLPIEYRNSTKGLWEKYGLSMLTKFTKRQLALKRDISVLFTYVCVDRYLKDSGRFGFLITQSVFKSKGAGESFRQFKLKKTNLKVLEVHDFTAIQPFEGANTRTSMITLKKGAITSYPIKYVLWKKIANIDQDKNSESVFEKLRSVELVAIPSDPTTELSPWLTVPKNAINIIKNLCGRNQYSVHEGINSGGANGVYFLDILRVVAQTKKQTLIPVSLREVMELPNEVLVKELLVENVTKGMKRNVEKVKTVIEDFFVYPVIKSKNVKKWKIEGIGNYILQMQNPIDRIGFSEEWVNINFPKTYEYLHSFKKILLSRKSKYIKNMIQKGAFFSIIDVGRFTYASYKVVWSRMGNKLAACVVSRINDEYLGEKLVLPDTALAFTPTTSEEEAHYVCAIMNSSIVDMIIRSIAGGSKSFATPKIIEDTIKIQRFDQNNEIHKKLGELSKQAHLLTLKETDLTEVEKEIDELVAKLYNISENDQKAVKETLMIQKGEIIK